MCRRRLPLKEWITNLACLSLAMATGGTFDLDQLDGTVSAKHAPSPARIWQTPPPAFELAPVKCSGSGSHQGATGVRATRRQLTLDCRGYGSHEGFRLVRVTLLERLKTHPLRPCRFFTETALLVSFVFVVVTIVEHPLRIPLTG